MVFYWLNRLPDSTHELQPDEPWKDCLLGWAGHNFATISFTLLALLKCHDPIHRIVVLTTFYLLPYPNHSLPFPTTCFSQKCFKWCSSTIELFGSGGRTSLPGQVRSGQPEIDSFRQPTLTGDAKKALLGYVHLPFMLVPPIYTNNLDNHLYEPHSLTQP